MHPINLLILVCNRGAVIYTRGVGMRMVSGRHGQRRYRFASIRLWRALVRLCRAADLAGGHRPRLWMEQSSAPGALWHDVGVDDTPRLWRRFRRDRILLLMLHGFIRCRPVCRRGRGHAVAAGILDHQIDNHRNSDADGTVNDAVQ